MLLVTIVFVMGGRGYIVMDEYTSVAVVGADEGDAGGEKNMPPPVLNVAPLSPAMGLSRCRSNST